MCEWCEIVKQSAPVAVPWFILAAAWVRSRLARRPKPPQEPACPLCGPVPRGRASCLCYEHYSQNHSYSRLFLEPLERLKHEEP